MKRTPVSWSDSVDLIEGPCAVCGKDVRFVVPFDRPNPALLYHSTCDMMPLIREQLKTATPPLMPAQNIINKPRPAPVAAPAVPPASTLTPPPAGSSSAQ
jgi:hypothetical protein